MANSDFSLMEAYGRIKVEDVPRFKADLKKALKIKSRSSLMRRLRGVEPKVSEAEAIEKVFEKHGVRDIWKKRSDERERSTNQT